MKLLKAILMAPLVMAAAYGLVALVSAIGSGIFHPIQFILDHKWLVVIAGCYGYLCAFAPDKG